MVTSMPLYKDDGVPLVNTTQFFTIVGALQYCTLTCPEISF